MIMAKGLTNSQFSQLKEIAKNYDLDLMVLFGSRAKGPIKEDSDYDIAVLFNKYDNEKFLELLEELEEKLLNKVDLVSLNLNEDPLLLKNISQGGICISERKKGLFDTFQVNSIFNYIDYSPLYKIEEEIVSDELNSI